MDASMANAGTLKFQSKIVDERESSADVTKLGCSVRGYPRPLIGRPQPLQKTLKCVASDGCDISPKFDT
jgi:hypothetical protein